MNNGYFLSHLFQLSNRRWADEADLAVALSNRNDAVLDLKLVWRKPSVLDDTREFISGFEYGADDYVIKPFAIEELLARLRAVLRRVDLESEYNSSKQTTVSYRDLVIEKENRVVRRGDEIIELTKREYELLLTLMENVNVVLARDVLLKEVWGYESQIETNVVDVYIRYLRNKIDRPGEDSYIQTVRGTGYVMRS